MLIIAMSVSVCLSVCPFARLNNCSAVAEIGDRLATIDIWAEKRRAAVPLSGGLGLHLTQCGMGRGLPQYQVVS